MHNFFWDTLYMNYVIYYIKLEAKFWLTLLIVAEVRVWEVKVDFIESIKISRDFITLATFLTLLAKSFFRELKLICYLYNFSPQLHNEYSSLSSQHPSLCNNVSGVYSNSRIYSHSFSDTSCCTLPSFWHLPFFHFRLLLVVQFVHLDTQESNLEKQALRTKS